MELIEALFDRLDGWRHLPSYQLERRADIFFSLYLPAAIEEKLGVSIRPILIPEFPVRVGTVCPVNASNKSFKIDYLALSATGDRAVFVELKTDMSSRRVAQDRYLAAAQHTPFAEILDGLLTIFRTTNAKRKYLYLFAELEKLGLLEIPAAVWQIGRGENLHGINAAARDIRIVSRVEESLLLYLQPQGGGADTITFAEFRSVVERRDDPLSLRFAKSLAEWAGSRAGSGLEG